MSRRHAPDPLAEAPAPNPAPQRSGREPARDTEARPGRSVIGWQGVHCVLPQDWSITGFSTDRECGYLRVDAPASADLAVQIRWSRAGARPTRGRSLYHIVAPYVRRFAGIGAPPTSGKPALKENLDRILKDASKQARKVRAPFDSTAKPEKVEGAHGERTAINFSWTGSGRGQGKIWHCATCNRILVAQVVGAQREQGAISTVAAQLFSTLRDHPDGEYELWALYDLQVSIPEGFLLQKQELRTGYLRLEFRRAGERLFVERWGLANVTLRKFTPDEWFRTCARVSLRRISKEAGEFGCGHEGFRYSGPLPTGARLRALRDAGGAPSRAARRYAGAVWHCAAANKIYAIQGFCAPRSAELLTEVVKRCVCH